MKEDEKTFFLDGAMEIIALLCEGINFVPSYGVINLEAGALTDRKILL